MSKYFGIMLLVTLILPVFTLKCYNCQHSSCKTPVSASATVDCEKGMVCSTFAVHSRIDESKPFNTSASIYTRACHKETSNSCTFGCLPSKPGAGVTEINCRSCCSTEKCNTDFPDWENIKSNSTPDQSVFTLKCYSCQHGSCKTPVSASATVDCEKGMVCSTFAVHSRIDESKPFNTSASIYTRACHKETSNSCTFGCTPSKPGAGVTEISCRSCCSTEKCNTDFPDWENIKSNSTPDQSASFFVFLVTVLAVMLCRVL
ncbi:uncharacterized protein LOC130614070 [Hydractinia symbiolongicarpus]|uniref:uncharacterized protein LOC130614070 n=1 Tax=Hydractinia symbiolongicarpus TaxID=13093 RepID=UPI00254ABC72|nr:uncharacterized protein LOC130614070 [Hydractinia symbiolongicarpus]